MKKKILSMVLVLSMGLGAASCADLSEEESALAEENAVNYVKDKYGFKAKVESVDPVIMTDLFVSKKDYAEVTMSYKGDEFTVFISHQEETTHGLDNYQWEEFTSIIEDKLTSQLDCSDMAISTTLEYTDENTLDIEDYYESYHTYINIQTCGVDHESLENLDASFLGEDYAIAIRDYKDLKGKEFPDAENLGLYSIISGEAILLKSFTKYSPSYGMQYTELYSQSFDGVTVVYDNSLDVEITPVDLDYRDFSYKNSPKDLSYPYPGLHLNVPERANIYFYFDEDLIPDDDNDHIIDIWKAGSTTVSSYGKKPEVYKDYFDEWTGYKELEGECDIAFVVRGY